MSVSDVGSYGVVPGYFIAQHGWKIISVILFSDISHVQEYLSVASKEMKNFAKTKQISLGSFSKLMVKGERKYSGDNHFCHENYNHEDKISVEGLF